MKGLVGIAHTAYMVSDMKASLEFYVNKLGFKHAFSIPNSKGEPWIEYLQVTEGQFVELFYPDRAVAGNSAYMHLCLRVESCEDTCAELMEKNVQIDVMPNQGADYNIQMWIHDPDGNPIEIMQISPLSPQAKADANFQIHENSK